MAGEAGVKFLAGDFRIVRPGAFVRCAVTGVPIPLEELKYWSVESQEAYASPEAVMRRPHPPQAREARTAAQVSPQLRNASSSVPLSATGNACTTAANAATSA